MIGLHSIMHDLLISRANAFENEKEYYKVQEHLIRYTPLFVSQILDIAIEENLLICVDRILNYFGIPEDLDTKERISYYRLFVKAKDV